jgi:hypothetical protein
MEPLHENKALYERMIRARPGNDNCPASSRALSFGRSVFPEDAVARITGPAAPSRLLRGPDLPGGWRSSAAPRPSSNH